MRYLDHEPGGWFLLEQDGSRYLDARYSYTALVDDCALIRLSDAELKAYRLGGHDYLSDLATRIHNSAPYLEKSRFFSRDLYRGPDGPQYRRAVHDALAGHT
ncbi:hypothetical protein [Micropruina sp.]|uniref:hypothetical protein n=1 Tax=Micropruina sp. TaxID=2737536 RepID=UPI0039E56203